MRRLRWENKYQFQGQWMTIFGVRVEISQTIKVLQDVVEVENDNNDPALENISEHNNDNTTIVFNTQV